MSKIPTAQSFRSVEELKYINAENLTRYRAIMRFLYLQYQRLNYWLKPEQIYQGIMDWNLHNGYTLEQCQIDLEQLETWGNLNSRHDGGKAVTIEEYLRKRNQYLITPYSIEIERLLENLENVRGYGGSLEPTLFDTIGGMLFSIKENAGSYLPGEALSVWNTLHESFQKLHETSVDYIASLQTAMADEQMSTEGFLLYKDSITSYLQDFIQALQRRSYRIEGNLNQITTSIKYQFFKSVIDDEWRVPKIEDPITEEQYMEELSDKWEGLNRWFIGEVGSESELILLDRATKEAILKMVRSALRIQERKRSAISRRKELDYLGRWFYGTTDLETSHQLSAYVFGLFSTRHLIGEDKRESDSQEMSMWKEYPINVTLRSRSRKKNERQDMEAVIDRSRRKEQMKDDLMKQHKRELQFLKRMVDNREVTVSQLGIISAEERLQILYWIGRCNTSSSSRFQTPEGIEIAVQKPSDGERTTMICQDGSLELLNYKITFGIINILGWNGIIKSLDL